MVTVGKIRQLVILSKVGDPILSSALSDMLLTKKRQYVQAINFPTVPRGQEKLRIAVTPHHSFEAMDKFVNDLVEVWDQVVAPNYSPATKNKQEDVRSNFIKDESSSCFGNASQSCLLMDNLICKERNFCARWGVAVA